MIYGARKVGNRLLFCGMCFTFVQNGNKSLLYGGASLSSVKPHEC
jgi:hypothetical protein